MEIFCHPVGEELVEDHNDAEDYDPDWDVSMDIRNEQSPESHIVDKNNEEEEDKDEGIL